MAAVQNFIEDPTTLPPLPLPSGVTSRYVDTSPISLKFHILESVPDQSSSSKELPPLILFVHGFPNLAYDWRYILPKIAAAGYHAVAFDQRGYGRTHNADLSPIDDNTFGPISLIRDVVALVYALGYTSIHTIVGHDFGAVTSTFTSISRPDLVKSLILMSHPFQGIKPFPYATSPSPSLPPFPSLPRNPKDDLRDPQIHKSMLQLSPPRKHYKMYYCTAPANDEMTHPTGPPLHSFLRGYFHLKSADNKSDLRAQPLKSWTADQLALMPTYYIMTADQNMRENVATAMSSQPPSAVANNNSWLPDQDLAVYVSEYTRTTFRGGLNWYRTFTDPSVAASIDLFAGAKIAVPMKFVSGVEDWGNYQDPGALEAMENGISVRSDVYRGTVMVPRAGHWVSMERPDECVKEILELAGEIEGKRS